MKKLETKTVKELILLARQWGVSGYSKLKKAELVKLLAGKLPEGIRPNLSGRTKSDPKEKAPRTAGSREDRAKPSSQVAKSVAASAQGKGRQATQAGRTARVKASKARLANGRLQAYAPPSITPVDEPAPPPATSVTVLPAHYGDGRMGLLPRDPHWLYCFWDLTDDQFQQLAEPARAGLRVILLGDKGDRQVRLIPLPAGASSWYVHVDDGDRTYRCDLCALGPDDTPRVILSSNPSSTPPDGVGLVAAKTTFAAPAQARGASPAADPQPDMTARPTAAQTRQLLRMSADDGRAGGLDSADVQGPREHQGAGGPASDGLHSAGLAGRGTPDQAEQRGDFWLRMDADLILYGATVPGASVTLAGVPLRLDPQGHFRARFALPDGGHGFELIAASPDAAARRRIQVRVDRRTEDPAGEL